MPTSTSMRGMMAGRKWCSSLLRDPLYRFQGRKLGEKGNLHVLKQPFTGLSGRYHPAISSCVFFRHPRRFIAQRQNCVR